MNDDDEIARRDAAIIEARVAGKSVRAIAKANGVSAAQVNKAIDRWADGVVTHEMRKTTLALELELLDREQEVFYQRMLDGDVQCGLLLLKIVERRGVLLGLRAPQLAVLKIVDDAQPSQTGHDRLESALERLISDQRAEAAKKDEEPTTN